MVITGLRADTRLHGCVIIEADGARIASLPAEILRELKLEIGLDLSPAQEAQVLWASAVEGARRVALRLLASRPRAVGDLKRRLRDRGHEAAAINRAVELLQASGLLNDEEFARHFVRVRSPRGHGPSRLIHDLLSLGVERRQAEEAVRDFESSEGVDVGSAARAGGKTGGAAGECPRAQTPAPVADLPRAPGVPRARGAENGGTIGER